jgi:hypothetical protein
MAALLLGAPAPMVSGSSTCPTAAEVSEALDGLIGPAPDRNPADHVELTSAAGATLVRLRSGADGAAIGERLLPATGSCAERARAAAVVIAGWHARLQGRPLALAPADGGATARAAGPARSGAPATAWRGVEADLLGFAAMGDGAAAPGLKAGVALRRPTGLVLRTALGFTGPHGLSIAGGSGRWWRGAAGVGAGVRSEVGDGWVLESGGELVLSALVIRGHGFPETSGGTTFDPGAAFAVRLGRAWGRATVFGLGGVSWWPRSQRVVVTGAAAAATLPRFEGNVGLGVSWRARP